MSSILSFSLLFVMPVIVGYVAYKILNHNHELWSEDIKRMGDDMF